MYENHYCLITKIHTLLNNNDGHCKFVCRRCLTTYANEHTLIDHIERCENQQPTKITFPLNDQLYFNEYWMKTNLPFYIVADFECMNIPTKSLAVTTNDKGKQGENTQTLFKQLPSYVGYYFINKITNENQYYYYIPNKQIKPEDWFVNEMVKVNQYVFNFFTSTDLPINMTKEDEKHFNETNTCWLCEKKIITYSSKKNSSKKKR